MEVVKKSRAVGATLAASVDEPIAQEERHENPEQLKAWLENFSRQYKTASADKERCEDLMRRPGASSWSQSKMQKMVRRLMAANKTVEQAENAMDHLTTRLSQLGIEVSVESRSAQNVA